MSNTLPKYLTNRKNTIRMVLWTALFAELFMTIYQPYNSRQWTETVNNSLLYFLWATVAVLVAMLVITLSRTIMCLFSKKHDITIANYAIWVMVEWGAMSVIYATMMGYGTDRLNDFLTLWGISIIYTSFVLLIPYAIVLLSLILQHNLRLLEDAGLRERSAASEEAYKRGMLHFLDDKGELRLSIQPSALYYIEGAENYVQVHYSNRGKMRSLLLRNTLRAMETMFDMPDLIRCHRSYIVNFGKVRVLKRSEEGLIVDFDEEGLPNLPVSKTYAEKVMSSFRSETLPRI